MANNETTTDDSYKPIASADIGPYDILCGRCKQAFNNVGNRRFRTTISLNLERYRNAKSRNDKTMVIHEVIEMLQKDVGARFLKKKPTGEDEFVLLDEKETRAKVGHAFRDMNKTTPQQAEKRRSSLLDNVLSLFRRPSEEMHSPTQNNIHMETGGEAGLLEPIPLDNDDSKRQRKSSIGIALENVLGMLRNQHPDLEDDLEQEDPPKQEAGMQPRNKRTRRSQATRRSTFGVAMNNMFSFLQAKDELEKEDYDLDHQEPSSHSENNFDDSDNICMEPLPVNDESAIAL